MVNPMSRHKNKVACHPMKTAFGMRITPAKSLNPIVRTTPNIMI